MEAVNADVRLIAIDIDGTLLNQRSQISDANHKALRRARERGIEIVLVTGRRHAFALPIARELGFDLWLISSNGAVTRSLQGELFYREVMPARTARELITHMDAFRGHAVVTFDGEARGAVVVERVEQVHASIARWMEKNEPHIARISPLEDALVSDPIQVMYCGTIERMTGAEKHLLLARITGEITTLKTEYVARDLCMLDVLNGGCSKGHALERWAQYRGLNREQVMAIGDNYNDIEMLSFAGVPVIMGNACEELKQNGWEVTLSNCDDGVAAAVEKILGADYSVLQK